jgi:hypothetical protein
LTASRAVLAVHQLSATTTSVSNLPGGTELLLTGTTANTPFTLQRSAGVMGGDGGAMGRGLDNRAMQQARHIDVNAEQGLPRVMATVSTPTLDCPMMVKREDLSARPWPDRARFPPRPAQRRHRVRCVPMPHG